MGGWRPLEVTEMHSSGSIMSACLTMVLWSSE